ncbi:hypothetical protein H6P81_001573 [Aristolochia fimbriata]|uniref:SUI1 domain-containing protein n=1 Tax=Aristolochia fimbriata TaxID=158543 RepID=A0AAV7F793_ARIFI|nr:hypothetical protein H6P81_001573 [Aristolochia fimbriata]
MFKKPIEAKSFSRLSGADRKKLRRTIKEKFPHVSDADLDLILPPKAEITVSKLPNRTVVYGVEGGFPMIFDVDGRSNEIFPTVYSLWTVPDLLPAFMLKGGEVSQFVIGGADLMFPGISIPPEGLPSFLAGQAWAVKVPGNPAPIAVGITTMSSAAALKAGLRGKALRILHFYRDSLWDSVEGHYVPNAGFLEDAVFEDPSLLSAAETSGACGVVDDSPIEALGKTENEGDAEQLMHSQLESRRDANGSAQDADGSTHIDNKSAVCEEIREDVKSLKIADGVSPEESTDEKGQRPLSIEEIDTLLDKCLLQALHTTVIDKDLPMSGSTLWSGHVLPCRPPGVTLDVKKSSHKKLAKWLHSKSSAGLISSKEDRHKKEVLLLSINRNHPDYMSFKPEKRKSETVGQTSTSAANEGRQSRQQLDVMEVYKPSTHVNPIFSAVGEDLGKYYTAPEASNVVFKYVEKENLVKPTDKAKVVLDAILCDALFKGTVKKGSSYPSEIHKKDLGSLFLSRMQIHHKVTRGTETALRKGALKTVQIMVERRQGNKKVTRVSGLESFLLDAETLAPELQKKFACSTSVAELPGSKKGQVEVLVQGGVIEDLARYLIEQYGVPKRYIEVLDKTKK